MQADGKGAFENNNKDKKIKTRQVTYSSSGAEEDMI